MDCMMVTAAMYHGTLFGRRGPFSQWPMLTREGAVSQHERAGVSHTSSLCLYQGLTALLWHCARCFLRPL
jgi:hypothetical protein